MTRADWKEYAKANGLSGDWARAHKYGMKPKELHAVYLEQDARCYLCRDPLPANLTKTAVDHDHSCCGLGGSCGLCVRGLACLPCNRLIALAQDDPQRLRRIADNLEAAHRMLGRRYASAALELPRLDDPSALLSNSGWACPRCQKWEDDCKCPAA